MPPLSLVDTVHAKTDFNFSGHKPWLKSNAFN